MVVIDTGFSMGEPMIAGDDKSQNPLATAQNLTMALMNTLSGSDFINIMVYNASASTLLSPNPVSPFLRSNIAFSECRCPGVGMLLEFSIS